jgi:hypothetical protein
VGDGESALGVGLHVGLDSDERQAVDFDRAPEQSPRIEGQVDRVDREQVGRWAAG